jgi:acetolactate synthase-1/2/3 large subunit
LKTPEEGALLVDPQRPELPTGKLDVISIASVLGALLPENAIVSDEAITSKFLAMAATEGCPRHDCLFPTGGCLGQGVPVGIGAAVACPDRKVVCLEGDGSSMYTLQSLWTAAREQLDVTVVVFANRAYAILGVEHARTTGPSDFDPIARELLDLSSPKIDFVSLSKGMGAAASRAANAEDFSEQFGDAMGSPGPKLIEVVL